MECTQCGVCCKTYYINLTLDDLKRWRKERRYDILNVADTNCLDGFWVRGGDEPYPHA